MVSFAQLSFQLPFLAGLAEEVSDERICWRYWVEVPRSSERSFVDINLLDPYEVVRSLDVHAI